MPHEHELLDTFPGFESCYIPEWGKKEGMERGWMPLAAEVVRLTKPFPWGPGPEMKHITMIREQSRAGWEVCRRHRMASGRVRGPQTLAVAPLWGIWWGNFAGVAMQELPFAVGYGDKICRWRRWSSPLPRPG